MQLLGENFDIHGGGRDLIFPHHENEIAQAQAFSGKPFANYWIHNGLLTINGQKMAKSLGNFVSMDEILASYHPDIIKLFFLSTHYSRPIDYSREKMEEARKARERFYVFFEKVKALNFPLPRAKKTHKRILAIFRNDFDLAAQCEKFNNAMDDDFNTPLALGSLFEMVSGANRFIEQKRDLKKEGKAFLVLLDAKILELGNKVFGLFGKPTFIPPAIKREIKKCIDRRASLRRQKRFRQADELRQEIYRKWPGLEIVLEDQKDGRSRWRIRER
jgi:cysteinyl-tRNA synthetase